MIHLCWNLSYISIDYRIWVASFQLCIFDQDLSRIPEYTNTVTHRLHTTQKERDNNQPPPAKISIIQSTNTQQRYPFLSRSKMSAKRNEQICTQCTEHTENKWRERERAGRKHARSHTQTRMKVNKIRCHIKMLWHFASDLCVCVEHIDYGNKKTNRWIKCRQRYAPTIIQKAHTLTRNDFSRRFGKWLQCCDKMKNQNVNNNKAPDKNLWHTFHENRFAHDPSSHPNQPAPA